MRMFDMRIFSDMNEYGVPLRPDEGPQRKRRAYLPAWVTFTAPFIPAS